MNSCSCVYVDIDDICANSAPKIITAKKKHECCECRKYILPGRQYERIALFCVGTVDVYKTCIDCKSVRDSFFCSWYYEEVWEELDEHIRSLNGEIASDCIVKLTKKARDRVCDMIERAWKEGA